PPAPSSTSGTSGSRWPRPVATRRCWTSSTGRGRRSIGSGSRSASGTSSGSLYRSETLPGLRSLGVLVREATEDLAATYPPRIQLGDGRGRRVSVRWTLPAALMRPVPVIVRQVLAEYSQQMSGVVDQNPVQALPAYRA